ncbi:short-chain dehydrogenase/reductase SDR [Zopfochytrium polystomum]|nr:short-chain dehydrogenase/reductase SDR [Zopfochytrium polystomum]
MSQKPVIVVAGYGPGISRAVAIHFAQKKGLAVALLARTESKLVEAEKELAALGITAKAFSVDLSDVDAVRATIASVRESLGPIHILFWNAAAVGTTTLLTDPGALSAAQYAYNVQFASFIAGVHGSLSDLKSTRVGEHLGAILVTGGFLEEVAEGTAKLAVAWRFSTIVALKAALRKAVQVLNEELVESGVYAGEVTVMGAVKGTPFDDGTATIEAAAVAERFEGLYEKRTAVFDAI